MNSRTAFQVLGLFVFCVGCGSDAVLTDGEDESAQTYASSLRSNPSQADRDTALLNLVNNASAQDLEALVGVQRDTAYRLVSTREQQGDYQTARAVDDVFGVGRATYARLRNYAESNGYLPYWPGVGPEVNRVSTDLLGDLGAYETVRFPLSVTASDEVLFTLEVQSGNVWAPAMELFPRGGTRRFAWSTPGEGSNAVLPWNSRGNGFVFRRTEDLDLVVSNQSGREGVFRLRAVCLSGPCLTLPAPEPQPEQPQPEPEPPRFDDQTLKPNLIRTYYTGHRSLGYNTARFRLFTEIYKESDGTVECVYTGQRFSVGNRIPDHRKINTEHVWPRSRGASRNPETSDLHHLLPTQSRSNSERGSWHYGVVTQSETWRQGGSVLGRNQSGEIVFEPRDETKGNVARASFYFSVMYNKRIKASEEAVLRAWHIADPVDADELRRNALIQKYQNSRNPFVERPELVRQIQDF